METPVKQSNRSEVTTDEENFEDELNSRRTSRAQMTKKLALNDSVSSLETIKSENRPHSDSNSETAALTGQQKQAQISYKKHSGSYIMKENLSSKHKLLSQRANSQNSSKMHSNELHSINDSQISSSREGSFRFLEHEEIEHTPTPRRAAAKQDDETSIQWSNNSDRLI